MFDLIDNLEMFLDEYAIPTVIAAVMIITAIVIL